MNFKRYLFATIALFIFIYLFEMLVHGYLLQGLYESTASVWRNSAEMDAHLSIAIILQFTLSAWSALIFSTLYQEGGIKNGLQFGLLFGVFAGILTASWYLWLPVPTKLGAIWFINGVVEGLGGGIILGIINKKQKIKTAAT